MAKVGSNEVAKASQGVARAGREQGDKSEDYKRVMRGENHKKEKGEYKPRNRRRRRRYTDVASAAASLTQPA